ncbi:hypothetical protein FPHOBKDP_00057 [Listeria phage LPJP1]|nr:hypothetical protein FPHOBKDP_00057 [Listeria phage LPJP1]
MFKFIKIKNNKNDDLLDKFLLSENLSRSKELSKLFNEIEYISLNNIDSLNIQSCLNIIKNNIETYMRIKNNHLTKGIISSGYLILRDYKDIVRDDSVNFSEIDQATNDLRYINRHLTRSNSLRYKNNNDNAIIYSTEKYIPDMDAIDFIKFINKNIEYIQYFKDKNYNNRLRRTINSLMKNKKVSNLLKYNIHTHDKIRLSLSSINDIIIGHLNENSAIFSDEVYTTVNSLLVKIEEVITKSVEKEKENQEQIKLMKEKNLQEVNLEMINNELEALNMFTKSRIEGEI